MKFASIAEKYKFSNKNLCVDHALLPSSDYLKSCKFALCGVRPAIGHCFLVHHCLTMLYESPADGQVYWSAARLLSRAAIKNSTIFYMQKNALIMTAVSITIHILFMEVNVCQKK
jgi:hypothetical protein